EPEHQPAVVAIAAVAATERLLVVLAAREALREPGAAPRVQRELRVPSEQAERLTRGGGAEARQREQAIAHDLGRSVGRLEEGVRVASLGEPDSERVQRRGAVAGTHGLPKKLRIPGGADLRGGEGRLAAGTRRAKALGQTPHHAPGGGPRAVGGQEELRQILEDRRRAQQAPGAAPSHPGTLGIGPAQAPERRQVILQPQHAAQGAAHSSQLGARQGTLGADRRSQRVPVLRHLDVTGPIPDREHRREAAGRFGPAVGTEIDEAVPEEREPELERRRDAQGEPRSVQAPRLSSVRTSLLTALSVSNTPIPLRALASKSG